MVPPPATASRTRMVPEPKRLIFPVTTCNPFGIRPFGSGQESGTAPSRARRRFSCSEPSSDVNRQPADECEQAQRPEDYRESRKTNGHGFSDFSRCSIFARTSVIIIPLNIKPAQNTNQNVCQS